MHFLKNLQKQQQTRPNLTATTESLVPQTSSPSIASPNAPGKYNKFLFLTLGINEKIIFF